MFGIRIDVLSWIKLRIRTGNLSSGFRYSILKIGKKNGTVKTNADGKNILLVYFKLAFLSIFFIAVPCCAVNGKKMSVSCHFTYFHPVLQIRYPIS